jgi:hypothetical protein
MCCVAPGRRRSVRRAGWRRDVLGSRSAISSRGDCARSPRAMPATTLHSRDARCDPDDPTTVVQDSAHRGGARRRVIVAARSTSLRIEGDPIRSVARLARPTDAFSMLEAHRIVSSSWQNPNNRTSGADVEGPREAIASYLNKYSLVVIALHRMPVASSQAFVGLLLPPPTGAPPCSEVHSGPRAKPIAHLYLAHTRPLGLRGDRPVVCRVPRFS